ncbi:hypothetical protein [Flavobacterium capsici]|uniref:Lipocalin-like domain-containing protein n=1 Tax=Flavobacterium capsici TaxID=3075618 RepID=A0AA96J4C3_9FLAO|nr:MULTISPECIES: hypothetical protein [unclassified Flavobacterium]WNM17866.1 hypothetical protein RN608_07550 [Flavobacterium sp. PMR2A8]WNM21919.1 hypothetical protein RN605_00850 [Flavobacterium sp. PMTSA4]
MKKILAFTILTLIFSCSNNNSSTSENASIQILGKWKLTSQGSLINGVEQLHSPENAACNNAYDVNFIDAGVFQSILCNPYSTPITSSTESGSWTITTLNNVSTLYIVYPSNTAQNTTCTIKQLDSQTLKLYTLFGNNINIALYHKTQ